MYTLTEEISELLEQPVNERGINAMLRCPFHEDDSPSFSIHLDEGIWHCFGCEERGNLDALARRLDKEVSYETRLLQAKQRAEEPESVTRDFSPLANDHLRGLRHPKAQGFIDAYCKPRGIRNEALERFHVGYDAERDALTFPYRDGDGRVSGIKYRYRSGFKASESGSVYGIFGVEHVIGRDEIIICEGESDTLSTYSRTGLGPSERGDCRAIGVAGTSGASVSASAWSRFSLSLMFARTIWLAYDADSAGDKCVDTAMRVLGDNRCRRLRPPEGSDLTEFYQSGGRLEDLMDD